MVFRPVDVKTKIFKIQNRDCVFSTQNWFLLSRVATPGPISVLESLHVQSSGHPTPVSSSPTQHIVEPIGVAGPKKTICG